MGSKHVIKRTNDHIWVSALQGTDWTPPCVVVVETYKSARWAERVRAHRADAPAPTSGPLQEWDRSPVNTERNLCSKMATRRSVPQPLFWSQPPPLSGQRLPPPRSATRGTSPGERWTRSHSCAGTCQTGWRSSDLMFALVLVSTGDEGGSN